MFELQSQLQQLPKQSGVYLMKNESGEVIYVGKARNLYNRVRQYFQNNSQHTTKTKTLVSQIAEFEYIVTDSELEALLLESTLIKQYQPQYNILLKDDKAYPYIKVTIQEDFPRVFVTRKREHDQSKYYGPFTDGLMLKELIALLQTLIPIRKCKKRIVEGTTKYCPCLYYDIAQCTAPCSGAISKQEYAVYVQQAIDLLEGRYEQIQKHLQEKMNQASANMEYEKAAKLRDQILSLQKVSQKQNMENMTLSEADVIALARTEENCLLQVFFIRNHGMMGRETYSFTIPYEQSDSELLTTFVEQFYSGTAYVPKELILQEVPASINVLQQYLNQKRGSKVMITIPQKGEKQKLLQVANQNAVYMLSQFGEKLKREQQRTEFAVQEIIQALSLNTDVQRIEAYDISHIQGMAAVGAMVVFEQGKPKRSDYRKFQIKYTEGVNDIGAMKEVLTRRFNHAIQEQNEQKNSSFTRFPDLILMDGGEDQVHAAKEVLFAFGIDIPVCGMVKDEHHRSNALYFEGKKVWLSTTSEGFQLITRIQNEVHRFAITYHRTLHQKQSFHSALDHIKFIGEVRKKALLRHFGSLDAIAKADISQLLAVECMTKQSAEAVYEFFRNGKK